MTGDPALVIPYGVPRSTAHGWRANRHRPVVTAEVLDLDHLRLQVEVLKLRQQVRKLGAVICLLVALLRAFDIRLDKHRLPEGESKAGLLRAIERAQRVLSLRGALGVLHLSPARYHRWQRIAESCGLGDRSSCPRVTPTRLTAEEISTMREMVESDEYRHVPTGRLAILAQRLGKVFASSTTWRRMVRERGWCRPRHRLYPAKPKLGIRASKPDEFWHVDTTLIKLLDHTTVYLKAVIDNYSRRILAWCLSTMFDPMNTAKILAQAAQHAVSAIKPPTVVADAGIENVNGEIDRLIGSGLFSRVLALREVSFSNSLIEAWWRSLKHQWLYLHNLDTVATLLRLVDFYVTVHNSEIPHAAFNGQTPDEMYFGTGHDVPDRIEAAKTKAREVRLAANRKTSCRQCEPNAAPGVDQRLPTSLAIAAQ